MKIRIASDLHLEAFTGRDPQTLEIDFLPKHEDDAESVLVLAGDISSSPSQLLSFLKHVEKRFKKTIYVPGNHEYYRHDYTAWNRSLSESFDNSLDSTVFALGKVDSTIIDDVRFIFGTLWGDGGRSLAEEGAVGWYLNDFRLISLDGDRFAVQDMKIINEGQQEQIRKLLKTPFNGSTVVVTHHMPSYALCHPRFGDAANGGFSCNMDAVINSDIAPDVWIHGHTHDTIDRELASTRIVCNPAGYRREWSSEFNTYHLSPKFIDV